MIKSFMLEDGLFRGTYIAADDVIQQIWEKHDYPLALRPLFSEGILLALALSGGIKYKGVFSLQIKGKGPITSLFVDVTEEQKVRAYMTYDADVDYTGKTKVSDLFGMGQMIFSVAALGQEPYQGIVALHHDSLVDVIKDYFLMSEQIDTELILRKQEHQGRCILLQRMPNKNNVSPEQARDLWETVCVLLNSVQDKELFSETLSVDELLFRLFHANKLTVFEPKTPVFECRCYRGKMDTFLKKMSPEERKTLYNDKAEIEVACQFCGEKYIFTKADLGD